MNSFLDMSHVPSNDKLFFGDYNSLIRIDEVKHQIYRDLADKSEGNTWFSKETDYSKDVVGKNALPSLEKRIFSENIAYQNLMDSGVSNIFSDIQKVASLPELQYLYGRISMEEQIHALTYSYGLNLVFGSEATEILNIVYSDPFIQRRMNEEINGEKWFYDVCIRQGRTDDEAKKSLLYLLMCIFILEGVKFPFSFFTTWNINHHNRSAIQGFSNSLRLIAWDEMTIHTTTGMHVMNTLRKDSHQGFSHLNDWFDKTFVELLKKAVDQELEWNRYLLRDGEIDGHTIEVGDRFIKYWADKRLSELKLPKIFNEPKNEVIDWFNSYRSLNGVHSSLQETDNLSYQKGQLINDLDSDGAE